ncbi:MAG: hypothetical protein Q8P84_00880 [Deltaproteobacteria bacterium]|nr:hypothetical protein [Deltaproteobacteria bacterium]
MSIGFDPKIKGESINAPLDVLEEAFRMQDENAAQGDPFSDPYAVQNDMDMLFAGARRAREFREANPIDPISIPDLEKDILGPMPKIGSRSQLMKTVIDRYTLVQRNLIDRRKNLAHALEGYLKPEEAMDIRGRMEAIDNALREIDKNVARAQTEKTKLEKLEEAKFQEELARRQNESSTWLVPGRDGE